MSTASNPKRPAVRASLVLLALAGAASLMSCAAPQVQPGAPPRADVSNCPACHAGNAAYPMAANVYKHWENSGHGQYVGRTRNRPDCDACHDLKGPAAEGHLDGRRDAAGANTFHLVSGYINPAPKNPWDVQVTFDQHCWLTCHRAAGISDMRHERDADPAKGASVMGQHSTFQKAVGLPMDDALMATGFPRPPYFVTCVTCHDPHGTAVEIKSGNNNRMVRESYRNPSILCSKCHL